MALEKNGFGERKVGPDVMWQKVKKITENLEDVRKIYPMTAEAIQDHGFYVDSESFDDPDSLFVSGLLSGAKWGGGVEKNSKRRLKALYKDEEAAVDPSRVENALRELETATEGVDPDKLKKFVDRMYGRYNELFIEGDFGELRGQEASWMVSAQKELATSNP